MIDPSETGFIRGERLMEALHLCDRIVSQSEVEKMLKSIDINQDDMITYDNMLYFLKKRKRDGTQKMKNAFLKFDVEFMLQNT